jgi:hypothetical protein
MSHPNPSFDLRSFLEKVAEKFQKRKWEGAYGKRAEEVIAVANEWAALHLPPNPTPSDIAQALLHAAENSTEGIAGLEEWLSSMPPLRRRLLSLEEIVEVLNCQSDLT